MANSSSINQLKEKIIRDIVSDPKIVEAIDKSKIDNPTELINNNIFKFNKNPNALQETSTFITVQVHLPEVSNNQTWMVAVIELWIVTENKNMIVDDIVGVSANRNDYISELIDKKFNMKYNYADFDKIVLERNVESNYAGNPDYLARQMLFVTKDLNGTLCEE